MAEGFVSSLAFGRELVENRTLKRTVELPELPRSFDPLRSLKASELLWFSLHLGALESLFFDIFLGFPVLINQLLRTLLSGTVEFQHRHIVTSNRRRCVDSCDGTVIAIIADRQEEDNLVFSGNNEGRLDDDSGSNDVRLNGGIVEQELRADETPGPSTTISREFLGLDSLFESVLVQTLRDLDVHLDSSKTIFENCNGKDLLMTNPLLDTILTQKMNDVRMDLSHMLETNSNLRSEELKEYYPPICWNSTKRLEFFCRLSDRLLLKARAPNQQDKLKVSLVKELESKNPPILGGQWNEKIDPNFRVDSGNSSQCQYNYKSVVHLLRFIRNIWHHRLELPEEFKLKFTGHGGEKCFYDYFDERFPNFLMKTYRAASRFCREETWFENFR